METWQEKAARIGAEVVIFDPDNYPNSEDLENVDGWAVYDKDYDVKVAFINAHRSTVVQGNIAYHELEHIEQGHSHYPFSTTKLMYESSANDSMLEKRVDDYVCSYESIDENTIIDVNKFLDLYELGHELYYKAEKIIKEKMLEHIRFSY
ncbi:hypothetical protein [Lactococcus protaetiae]|uniref:IrrE N-terminal-like domain-containing protein n=1 Tax=Lactococcus protaetiae TaxID=2592653 RepID=A0A514ZA85_9LACT|nr:hypothetical protein [Lactococcus protaetiae]QDK71491.1 hypothetical protein FLP15_10355 [Lactococcus protaetiae]